MTPFSPRSRSMIFATLATALMLVVSGDVVAHDATQDKDDGDDKPELSLSLRPRVGFSPVRVTAIARLDGGADDYEEYYCAEVEWDWGDDNVSGASSDCDPYEASTSEIRRSFRGSHTFQESGQFEVRIRLIRSGETVAFATAVVDVRASLRPVH